MVELLPTLRWQSGEGSKVSEFIHSLDHQTAR